MKKILALLIFILSIQSANAIIEEKKIDLQGAIEIALKTNPQMQLAKLDSEISKNKIKEANRLQNPSLEFFQNIPKTGNGEPQMIGVDYTIELLKRGKRKDVARTKTLAHSDNENFLQQTLIAEVKKSYINLLVKKSHLWVLREQEKTTKELYETIQKEAEKGNIPQTEVVQAKIVLNRAIMYSNVARSEAISAQNYFNTVMNTSNINYDTKEDYLPADYSVLMAISPNSNMPTFEKIKEFALNNRYDLAKAKKEVLVATKNLEVVKSKRIPDLELTGGYAYQTKGMSDTGRFQSGGYVGASLVNLPILYNYKPEIQNAEIEIQKAELKYKDMEIDAIRNLTDAWEKFTIAKDNLILYNEKLLSDSMELMNASKKNLREKEIDLTTYLISKKLYLELILGYQNVLGEYYSSFADVLKEINSDNLSFEKI